MHRQGAAAKVSASGMRPSDGSMVAWVRRLSCDFDVVAREESLSHFQGLITEAIPLLAGAKQETRLQVLRLAHGFASGTSNKGDRL